MRRYETVVIVHPSLSQEERQPLLEKLTNLIPEPQGLLIKLDPWGQKRLAYVIKKQTRGFYVLLEYCGDGALVKELERNIRLDDRALKYMTVCIDPEVNLEKVKTEIEAAKQAEAPTEAEPEVTSPVEEKDPPPEEASEKAVGEKEEAESTPQSTDEEEPTNGSV
jgi:small subunit ribosomal protein S6